MDDFIPTRCARVKKNVQESFVSVQFTAHKKKVVDPAKSQHQAVDSSSERDLGDHRRRDSEGNVDPRKQQELEMKRARYDVIKFGMSGLRNVEAHKAKVAAAIALGARPPKQKTMNYKELKAQREAAKRAAKKKEHVSGADKSLTKRKVRKVRKSQKDTGILGVYGKVERGTKA